MKLKTFVLPLVGGLFASTVFAADHLPKPLAFARYQAMAEKSPFAVATAVVVPPVAPNFAKDLYIANAAKASDGDLVTVASSADRNLKEYLTSGAANAHGFSIANIEWSDKVGETKVTIAKDGQFATLAFNQAVLSQPLAINQPPPQQPIPPQGGVPQPGAIPPPPIAPLPNAGMPVVPSATGLPRAMPVPSIPTLPTPPSRVRAVIPRSPGTS